MGAKSWLLFALLCCSWSLQAEDSFSTADVEALMKTCTAQVNIKDFKSKFVATAVKAEKFISKTTEKEFWAHLQKEESLYLFFAYTWPAQFKLRGWNWGGLYMRQGKIGAQLREAIFASKPVKEKREFYKVWRSSVISGYVEEKNAPPMVKSLLKCYENLANK